MATLPNPYKDLTAAEQSVWDHMAEARSHAEGRPELGKVYQAMFNNPGLAEKVGALGEQIRFAGVLSDRAREAAILRYSYRRKFGYEWAHHQRSAKLAGLTDELIAGLGSDEVPAGLGEVEQAVVTAVDAVVSGESIPAETQTVITEDFGDAGVVEVVVLCGLYAIMGYAVTAFDIAVEEGLPKPPF